MCRVLVGRRRAGAGRPPSLPFHLRWPTRRGDLEKNVPAHPSRRAASRPGVEPLPISVAGSTTRRHGAPETARLGVFPRTHRQSEGNHRVDDRAVDQSQLNFERPLSSRPDWLLGYYDLDGRPLAFTEKRDAPFPTHGALTLHRCNPFPVNATTTVIRRQYQAINPRAATNQFTLGFGQLPDAVRRHPRLRRAPAGPSQAALPYGCPDVCYQQRSPHGGLD